MHSVDVPRLLIGAPASNAGKTTVTCAVLRALQRHNLALCACKCGPDYIDPLFHAQVIGVPSCNIDLFFADEPLACSLVARHGEHADLVLMEGAMGFYDGIGVSDCASAWDTARATNTPCVLVVDARGRARSIAAEVAGYAYFRKPSMVCGVILNRLAPAMFDRVKALVEEETGIPVLGYLPVLPDCSFESRHLGLVTAPEIADLANKLDALADAAEKSIDLDALIALAHTAGPLEADNGDVAYCPASSADTTSPASSASRIRSTNSANPADPHPVIAVARDEAFCFYYADTLDLLERLGAKLVEFSPLADTQLPAHTCGLYLGGGYPELHAQQLSENTRMCHTVRAAIESGMPTIAECGGFLYLHDTLRTADNAVFPLAGVIHAEAFPTNKLGRFGYVTLTAHRDSLLAPCGGKLRAHEFHYWDSTAPGTAFTATKPLSERSWECAHVTNTLYAGFPHLYLPAHPQAAARFVDACAAYATRHAAAATSAGASDAAFTQEAPC